MGLGTLGTRWKLVGKFFWAVDYFCLLLESESSPNGTDGIWDQLSLYCGDKGKLSISQHAKQYPTFGPSKVSLDTANAPCGTKMTSTENQWVEEE